MSEVPASSTLLGGVKRLPSRELPGVPLTWQQKHTRVFDTILNPLDSTLAVLSFILGATYGTLRGVTAGFMQTLGLADRGPQSKAGFPAGAPEESVDVAYVTGTERTAGVVPAAPVDGLAERNLQVEVQEEEQGVGLPSGRWAPSTPVSSPGFLSRVAEGAKETLLGSFQRGSGVSSRASSMARPGQIAEEAREVAAQVAEGADEVPAGEVPLSPDTLRRMEESVNKVHATADAAIRQAEDMKQQLEQPLPVPQMPGAEGVPVELLYEDTAGVTAPRPGRALEEDEVVEEGHLQPPAHRAGVLEAEGGAPEKSTFGKVVEGAKEVLEESRELLAGSSARPVDDTRAAMDTMAQRLARLASLRRRTDEALREVIEEPANGHAGGPQAVSGSMKTIPEDPHPAHSQSATAVEGADTRVVAAEVV